MNEKFGFLSNFKGIKVQMRKNVPSQGELTDNPHLLHYEPELTDDESDGEEATKSKPKDQKKGSKVNRILESNSSSTQADSDLDKTYCSELEEFKNDENSSPDLFNSEDLKSQPVSVSLRETIVGSFSDDELCSRMSEVNVAVEIPKPVGRNTNARADTIIGFSDVSDDDEEEVKLSDKLRETVIQSSSEDELEDSPNCSKKTPKKPPKKLSLPDTVIGFSEISSSDPPPPQQFPCQIPKTQRPQLGYTESMQEKPSTIPEEVVYNSDNSDLSEYEDEVISVLDSDEEDREISTLNDDDQPPLVSIGSYRNCSSVRSSRTRTETQTNSGNRTGTGTGPESDNTLNRFFNNPPSITSPEVYVTHSMIRGCKKAEANYPRQNAVPKPIVHSESLDHVNHNDSDVAVSETDESSIHESIEIPETDVSDIQEIREDSHQVVNSAEALEDDDEEEEEVCQSELIRSDETKVNTQSSAQSITQAPLSKTVVGKINFSASININLKISLRESCGSSSSESCEQTSSSSSSCDSQPSPPPRKQASTKNPENVHQKEISKAFTPNKKVDSVKRKENQAVQTGMVRKRPEACASPSLQRDPWVSDFFTPVRHQEPEKIIDEDLQEILDSLYGDTWKTPQLLKSCKSKIVRQELRKSIHANNFEVFVKNLPKNLDSTRIGENSVKSRNRINEKSSAKKKADYFTPPTKLNLPTTSSRKKPIRSVKKASTILVSSASDSEPETPPVSTKLKKTVPKTPVERCREICDSDTPFDESSSGSDTDFNADDIWNASSDEEYDDEQARIKKRSIARKSRKEEEIIFVPSTIEDKKKKLEDLLDRSEFKKQSGMPATPKNITKKKLFSHDHFEDDLVEEASPREENVKENVAPALSLREIFFRSPFPITKGPEKKLIEPTSATKDKRTPKARVESPKIQPLGLYNNFEPYSFLKSLSSEALQSLCNPDALYYRKSYKTSKEKLTDILFKMYNEKVFDGVLNDVTVKWNKKLTHTAGRCNNSRREGVRKSQLELSDKVLTSADRLRCTLIHEMCHAVTWIVQGDNGHGATWKRWAAKANAIFPELPKINVCHEYQIEYKYTYQCVNCKAKYQTHSKSKKVESIRCSVCKGTIELFLNKKNKDGEIVMTPVSKNVKGFPKFVKLNYKTVKKPGISHKEVMQILSSQFGSLSVEEKQNL